MYIKKMLIRPPGTTVRLPNTLKVRGLFRAARACSYDAGSDPPVLPGPPERHTIGQDRSTRAAHVKLKKNRSHLKLSAETRSHHTSLDRPPGRKDVPSAGIKGDIDATS